MKYFFTFILLWFSAGLLFAQNGKLRGLVVDAMTNEPLSYVNILVLGTTSGTVSDSAGQFELTNLNPGFIKLKASYVGYETTISGDIEINNAYEVTTTLKMEPADLQLAEVTVTANPFRKTEESPLSMRSIGIGEIETNPGANRDISKVIQSFPGVTSSSAYRNDLIIRGGGPSENVFYLDGIEVPNINHFATQGASGGPVGILNADFIREVKFYSGAFPADRGDALSGVLEFTQVDGNTEKLNTEFSVGASEVSLTLDGPVGKKTTFIFSVRRSYLQLLFSALQLPFLPTFNDTQFKVKMRLNQKNELTFIGLGAIDQFDLNTDIENPTEFQEYVVNNLAVNEQWTYTIGAVYKHFHRNGYSTVALSRNMLNNDSYKYFDNDESDPANLTLDYHSWEIENKLRVEDTRRFDGYKLNFGANIDLTRYTNNTYQKRYDANQLVEVNYDTDLYLLKYGLFAQASKSFLSDRLTLSLGTRMDANNYSSAMNNPFDQFSPRFSASYRLSEQWTVTANVGRYYQLPPYTSLGYKANNVFVNKQNRLQYIRADHYIAGVAYTPSPKVEFTLESFFKRYSRYPFSVNDSISLANKGADYGVLGDEAVLSIGKGRAYGAEFLMRFNNRKNLNANASYTWSRSEFIDPGTGTYVPTTWDSKHLLTLYATYKLNKSWSAGAKWRFVGKLPYTPYDLKASANVESWEANAGPVLDYSKFNSERLPAFHQLDIRVDKVWYLNKFTLKLYVDVQNVYNYQSQGPDIIVREKDANGQFITTDNSTEYVLKSIPSESGTVLPTLGVIFKF